MKSDNQQPSSGLVESKQCSPPKALEGLSIPPATDDEKDKSLVESESTAPVREYVPRTHDNILPFATHVHTYVWSSITFAEQKAAFVFAVASAFLGYLATSGIVWLPLRDWGNLSGLDLVSGVATAALILSIGLVIDVVVPRLGGDSGGLVYFGSVAQRVNAGAYVSDVLTGESELGKAVAAHTFEISRISRKKFRRVRMAILIGIVGFAAGFAAIGLKQEVDALPPVQKAPETSVRPTSTVAVPPI